MTELNDFKTFASQTFLMIKDFKQMLESATNDRKSESSEVLGTLQQAKLD